MNRKHAIFYILFDIVAALLVWLLFYLYRRITNDMVILGGNVEYYFNEGERVFHEKLGIGHILEVIQVGASTMYTIDFGTNGKKAMDASFARLKKF